MLHREQTIERGSYSTTSVPNRGHLTQLNQTSYGRDLLGVNLGITLSSVDELPTLVGTDLGSSDWIDMAQNRVNDFARVTEDHQWIHTDPDRAARESPFGGPIAHGYLTLSLLSAFWEQLLEVDGVSMAVNYGLNKVRFPAPVAVGSRVRMAATVISVAEIAGGFQVVVEATFESDGVEKPVCVAEPVFRLYR
jgi:acyl dehydratase